MVGEDGRAVALGGAPDHHVQKAVGRLNVMFLERERAKMLWAVPAPGSSGERAGGQPGAAGPAGRPPGPTGGTSRSHHRGREDGADGAPFPGQGVRHRDNGWERPGPLPKPASGGAVGAQALLHAASGVQGGPFAHLPRTALAPPPQPLPEAHPHLFLPPSPVPPSLGASKGCCSGNYPQSSVLCNHPG